jgi:hypothetical protein
MNVSFDRLKRTKVFDPGRGRGRDRICREEAFKFGAVMACFGQAYELEHDRAGSRNRIEKT